MAGNSEKTGGKPRGGGRPFVKGDPRINREGRPQGTAGFAELIRERTEDGWAMVELALGMVQGTIRANASTKLRAAEFLTDRMLGRTPQTIELTGKGGGPLDVKLQDARARLAQKLAALATTGAPPATPREP